MGKEHSLREEGSRLTRPPETHPVSVGMPKAKGPRRLPVSARPLPDFHFVPVISYTCTSSHIAPPPFSRALVNTMPVEWQCGSILRQSCFLLQAGPVAAVAITTTLQGSCDSWTLVPNKGLGCSQGPREQMAYDPLVGIDALHCIPHPTPRGTPDGRPSPVCSPGQLQTAALTDTSLPSSSSCSACIPRALLRRTTISRDQLLPFPRIGW